MTTTTTPPPRTTSASETSENDNSDNDASENEDAGHDDQNEIEHSEAEQSGSDLEPPPDNQDITEEVLSEITSNGKSQLKSCIYFLILASPIRSVFASFYIFSIMSTDKRTILL